MKTTRRGIASLIDHTNLKPDARRKDIERLCEEAVEHRFASVCVNPCYARLAAELLRGSGVKVCCVVGFPLGASSTESKAFEAAKAAADGAEEIDMVINISWLKDGEYGLVKSDIAAVVDAVPKCPVKVILETCLLEKEEIAVACGLAAEAGASFVKTSTGFSKGGASVEDVALMRLTVGDRLGVKASGGIRDYETAAAMVAAGASRLGTSQSLAICGED